MKLLELLTTHKACSTETLKDLFSSPAFRKHVAGEQWKLARLKLKEIATGPVSAKQTRLATFQRSSALMRKYDREELYKQVWERPMQTVAKEYGVSDVALAKTCRKLEVPVPGRGYWAKIAAGARVPKKPFLPRLIALRKEAD